MTDTSSNSSASAPPSPGPPSSWATQESPALLWFEQSNNAAVFIGAVAYGIHMVVFGMTVVGLLRWRKWRDAWPWLLYTTILFGFGTTNLSLNIHFNELAWIDERNYPGGPLAFLLEQEAYPGNTAGNAAAIIVSFMADGLLLYRCYRVWYKWYIMVIPTLMYLAATILSALTTFQAARPTSSLWSNNTIQVSVPYWSISMALTILLSTLLIARLLYFKHQMAKAFNGGQHPDTLYSHVVAIILEAALPYSLVALIFIILYGLQNTAENLFIPLLVQVECLSPMLIIMRVCQGRAMDHHGVTQQMTDIKFNRNRKRSSTGNDKSSPDLSEMTFKPASSASGTLHDTTFTVSQLA